MADDERIYLTKRDSWRNWLMRNHAKKKSVWLTFYKKRTGNPSMTYDDAVEEAICFGWIDSIIKRIDDKRFARKFTPRKEKSRWSQINKKRAEKLAKEGRMTSAGIDSVEKAKASGEWTRKRSRADYAVPSYVLRVLAANKKALENFSNLAESYKRHYIGWITSAKREDTRMRRLQEALKLLEQNKKLGMK